MPLTAGDKLGPYEVLELIGKGGMGEVYRAHDPRTGRDVALKVSAGRFSERFDREVRAVASLNHPNICTLFDVGPNYLVMELVEGSTLAERLKKEGPIPIGEALAIAKQIVEALEAAHEKGVVHRDLKPGNAMLRPDGSVKVLDFGLAKVGPRTASDGPHNPEQSPTISMAATQSGVILGTAAYMSPEQARGKAVDKRADIWAFGVVLYEMVTAKRLFQGEDLTETLASVVKERPDLSEAPPRLRRLIQRCVEKDPRKRLRDIGDVWELLEESESRAEGPRHSGRVWPISAAVLVVTTVIALWAPWRAEKVVDRPLVRLDVDLGADVSLPPQANYDNTVAISPDGTRLAYVSGSPANLYLRRLDQPKATELPGTGDAESPFFSPDGQWVGFVARSKLNKISVDGGAVVSLADSAIAWGASWGEDGSVIAVTTVGQGLVRIPSAGGMPTPVTELANGELLHRGPQILPGGKAVLFAAFPAPPDPDKASIDVITLADHRRKTLVRGTGFARYVAASSGAGYLLYLIKGTLFAIPFDLERLETSGTAIPVLGGSGLGVGVFAISSSGTLVYPRGSGGPPTTMTVQWLDAAGKHQPLLAKPGYYQYPRLSPDGKLLLLTIGRGSGREVWAYDPQRDAMNKLLSGVVGYQIWSPDGRYVVANTTSGLVWTRADGAGQPQPLTTSKNIQYPWSFSPDGKRVAYFEIDRVPQIWTVPIDAETDERGGKLKPGKPEQFLESKSEDFAPAFSPDGRWLAYTTDNSGKNEIEVRPFPPPASGQGGKWQVSNSGGQTPLWSRASHELFYMAGDQGDQIMVVSYTVKDDLFEADKPRVWADKAGGTWFDLAPDGKRVAVLTPVAAPEGSRQEHEVVFLENFADELRRKVPLGK